MNYISVITGRLANGRYRAWFWGQPRAHMSDWNGTNYRFAAIPDPSMPRDFATRQDAERWVKRHFTCEEDAEELCVHKCGDGMFLSDKIYRDRDVRTVRLPRRKKPRAP